MSDTRTPLWQLSSGGELEDPGERAVECRTKAEKPLASGGATMKGDNGRGRPSGAAGGSKDLSAGTDATRWAPTVTIIYLPSDNVQHLKMIRTSVFSSSHSTNE